MNNQKAWEDLIDSINIIESSIQLFHSGDTSAYRSIAVQLRILLCDPQHPLLPRVCRQTKLHPLYSYRGDELDRGIVFQMPVMISPVGENGLDTAGLFDGEPNLNVMVTSMSM